MFVLAACAHPVRQAQNRVAAPSHAAASPTVANSTKSNEAVLAMLVRRCGECHQSSRPTAVADALAIFDLDDAGWPQRFDAHRVEVALARLGKGPESDRQLFLTFHPHEAVSPNEHR
jgi:hypothetical protein